MPRAAEVVTDTVLANDPPRAVNAAIGCRFNLTRTNCVASTLNWRRLDLKCTNCAASDVNLCRFDLACTNLHTDRLDVV